MFVVLGRLNSLYHYMVICTLRGDIALKARIKGVVPLSQLIAI